MSDTIYAFASGVEPAAIAVLRVSGPGVSGVVDRMVRRKLQPRRAELVSIQDPDTGELLDRGLALLFPGPASVTGEDCLELHLHGGRAVRQAVLGALGRCETRLAQPGEFTRRAFYNGKMDLGEVEGLADLIEAQTEAQRRQALVGYGGALGRKIAQWRDALTDVLASLEAEIDFSDEADVQTAVGSLERLQEIAREMNEACALAGNAEIVRDGYTVLIAGAPNVGKSSLINYILGREAILVSDLPGTTRDLLEFSIAVQGYKVNIVDSAGVRATEDDIERSGIERAIERAANVDLVLWLFDSEANSNPDLRLVESAADLARVRTKADLGPALGACDAIVSVVGPQGADEIWSLILRRLQTRLGVRQSPVVVSVRQQQMIAMAAESLAHSFGPWRNGPELVAEDVREAIRHLDVLSGRVDPEGVLGRIFERFCIGK